MTKLTIEISDAMKEFVDQEVAAGHYPDSNALVQALLALAMCAENGHAAHHSDDDKQRIDHMLLRAIESCEQAKAVAISPGEFTALAQRLVSRQQGKHAS